MNQINLSVYGDLARVSRSLSTGCKLRAFRSGGGLRVLRMEDELGILIGYGEHPNVSGAFRILVDDIIAGGRGYADVYGKIEPHYIAGSASAEDAVDAWLLCGHKLEITGNIDGECTAHLEWLARFQVPELVKSAARKGATLRYKDERGVEFETGPYILPSGDRGITTRCVSKPSNVDDVWCWEKTKMRTEKSLAALLSSDIWTKEEL
jgi:hypothetical protein